MILQVVGNYVELKRSGHEYKGLCPFHSEKTPSFYVNEDKEVFYCHGCGEKGDLIRFVELIEHVDRKSARLRLGLGTYREPAWVKPLRSQAKRISVWANDLSHRVAERLRDIGQDIEIAKISGDQEIAEILDREWAILETLHEDLGDPRTAIEMWRNRLEINPWIEAVLCGN